MDRWALGCAIYSGGTVTYVKATVKTGVEHHQGLVQAITLVAVKAASAPTLKRRKALLGLGRVNLHYRRIKPLANGRDHACEVQ
jgi:hypothetical protein